MPADEADDREHIVAEIVSALYRLSPGLALAVPRETLTIRVEHFVTDLEHELMPTHED